MTVLHSLDVSPAVFASLLVRQSLVLDRTLAVVAGDDIALRERYSRSLGNEGYTGAWMLRRVLYTGWEPGITPGFELVAFNGGAEHAWAKKLLVEKFVRWSRTGLSSLAMWDRAVRESREPQERETAA